MKPPKPKQPQRKGPALEQSVAYLQKLGLAERKKFKRRIDFAMRTGRVADLNRFIRRNQRTIQKAKNWQLYNAQLASLDAFHPRPMTEDFMGNIYIADIVHDFVPMESRFSIAEIDLPRHIGIFGQAGMGKSNATLVIIKSIIDTLGDRVRVWIFEPKKRYRHHLYPDFLTLSPTDFIDESFIPPTDYMEFYKWRELAISLHATELYFQTGGKNLLNQVTNFMIDKLKIKRLTHAKILDTLKNWEKYTRSTREKETLATLQLRFDSLSSLEKNSRKASVPVSKLLNHNIIFEVGDLTPELQNFRTALLILKLYTYKQHELHRGKDLPFNLIVVEEARQLFAERKGDFGTSVLETVYTLAREMEIGFVVITQEPSSISKTIKSNMYTRIAFPLSEGEELWNVKRSQHLNNPQFDYYVSLSAKQEGHAMVRYGRYPEPFPVKFPLFGDES